MHFVSNVVLMGGFFQHAAGNSREGELPQGHSELQGSLVLRRAAAGERSGSVGGGHCSNHRILGAYSVPRNISSDKSVGSTLISA